MPCVVVAYVGLADVGGGMVCMVPYDVVAYTLDRAVPVVGTGAAGGDAGLIGAALPDAAPVPATPPKAVPPHDAGMAGGGAELKGSTLALAAPGSWAPRGNVP